MIDIHSHILFCGDDGAGSEEETIKMGQEFARTGVEIVAATPHFIRGNLEIEPPKIISLTGEYNSLFEARGINTTILPGMEVEMCHEIPGLFKGGKLLTLNNLGRHMLIELPFHSLPSFTQQVFYELRLLGITPILAHPERNGELIEHPELVYEMVRRGILVQINAGSLLGHFGTRVRKTAVSLIVNNLAHFVAGDAHQAHGERGPCLHLVRPILTKIVGEEKTQVLLKENPRLILEGENAIHWEPNQPKTGFAVFLKKVFGK